MPLPKNQKKGKKSGKSYPVPPKFNPNRNPMKPSTGNVLGYVKGVNAVVNTAAKYASGLIGGMKLGRTASGEVDYIGKAPRTVGRAVKAAGMSLLKDYQGSGVQQRFEGTPMTVETKYETESSPSRGTISYPDEGTANAPRSKKRKSRAPGKRLRTPKHMKNNKRSY